MVDAIPSCIREDCFIYVFKDEPWFKEHVLTSDRLIDVVQFLQDKGYKVAAEPQSGQIVLYCLNGDVKHYGKVVRLENGDSIVRSKFGSQNVNEHPLELVPYDYGTEVFFLTPSPKKSES